MRAYTRIDDRPIRRHDSIEHPDVVVVLEPSLLHDADVTAGLAPDGMIVANTEEGFPGAICVPATRLAPARSVNLVMLGALAAVLGEPPLDDLVAAACEVLGKKADPESAARCDRRRPRVRPDGGAVPDVKPWYDLPVGGTVLRDEAEQPITGGWRTGLKPEVDLALCVNCLLCWLYCPDSAVRPRRHDVRRLRLRPLQGLRDLRRDVPDGRDRDGRRDRCLTCTCMTGGEAVAHAMRQIDPDVVPVYPITPQTPIIQGFAKFVADGTAHAEIVNVESEHSAMSAAIGSALAGARTITATSLAGPRADGGGRLHRRVACARRS